MLADGATLYIAGQQLQARWPLYRLLSTMDLATNTVTGKYSISDGYHTKLLFGDDNTLWIGSQSCATGERAKLEAELQLPHALRSRVEVREYRSRRQSCRRRNSRVPFPNANENQYYYGDLTGLCWVQNLHKMYTAYGGQVHAFNTADGSEIDNSLITIQGTALDVAFMDAITNAAN